MLYGSPLVEFGTFRLSDSKVEKQIFVSGRTLLTLYNMLVETQHH